MARLPITIYKRSVLATMVSFCTTFFYAFAIVSVFSQQWVVFILCLAGGFGCMVWAEHINDKKIFKLWIEDLEKKGLREAVAASAEQAVALYNANPCKLTLKYIAKLNPQAGNFIAEQIQLQKKE